MLSTQNTILLAIATLLLILIAGAIAFFAFNPQSQQNSNTDIKNPFGTVSNTPSTQNTGNNTVTHTVPSQASSTQPTFSVQGVSGASIVVTDFRNDPGVASTTQDASGLWWFPGSDATTTPAAGRAYDIFYYPQNQMFTIVLLNEPIAQARFSATVDLSGKLGLQTAEMCSLRYEVNVPFDVNSVYSAKNLGFAGCPGATKLPGD